MDYQAILGILDSMDRIVKECIQTTKDLSNKGQDRGKEDCDPECANNPYKLGTESMIKVEKDELVALTAVIRDSVVEVWRLLSQKEV